MSEYRIDIKIRNNLILKKLNENGYKTLGEFCRKNGLMGRVNTLGRILNMQDSPLDCEGNFKVPILRLCEIINCCPENLFTESQLHAAVKSNKKTLIVNEAEMKFFLENTNEQKLLEDDYDSNKMLEVLDKTLDKLTPREKQVLEMKFYENMTFEQIANKFDVTKERIRQIQEVALRKLRNPRRHVALREFVDS